MNFSILSEHLDDAKNFFQIDIMDVPKKVDDESQGWVKTGISQDKTIQDRDKILKLKTRQTQDRHIAVKTIQDFQVIKTFGSRQVKIFNFFKIHKTRQIKTRFLSRNCQEKFKKWLIFD